ncbi:MAG: lamin tail domain-containing protein, partial [Christensenellaceae bacterium]|nr:lamin tail domain-containing protein [Christensenellaceae bacterium]
MKRVVSVFLALAMMFAAAGCAVPASAENTGGIVISEVVTSNSNSLKDPLFGQPDWIELYNSADSPINLSGYTFSEGRNNTYTFPDIEIKPGEYLVVYCCAFSEGVETEALCTGFKLSKKGVTLTLSTPKETIQTLEVPELETDISWGLAADGTYKYFIPTPGAANTTRSFASLDELKTTEKVALKITEVQPEGITDSEPYGWVELYNDGAEPIELSSLYITENLSNPTKARMPDMLLEPGAYAVLRFTGQTGAGELPFSIGADEHTLAVTNSMGAIVDMISWDSDIVPGLSVGPGSDGKVVYYTQPTSGEANGGPALESGSFAESAGDLRINELLLKNTFSAIDEDGERSAWVELCNASNGPLDLGNYALSANGNRLLKWRLPSRQVKAGEYVLVFLSGKDRTGAELHASFRLGAGETKLYLTQLNTGTFETADVPRDPQDNVSYGLSADGKWLYFPQPTPLAPNTTKGFAQISAAAGAASSGLMISEVAAVGTAKSGAMDWVEIYNGQDSDVDLSGYYLSDSRSNLKKWPIGPTT